MKNPLTWIVVADGSRARFYRLADDHRSIAATEQRLEWSRARGKAEDLMSDRAGQGANRMAGGSDSGAQRGHAVAPETDPKEVEKERFHVRVAEAMHDAVNRSGVERFVLAADPKTLGALRDALAEPVRSRLVAELDKDYTEASPETLFERVRPALPSNLG